MSTTTFAEFTNASFADSADSFSQLGDILILFDTTYKVNIMHYASMKSKQSDKSKFGVLTLWSYPLIKLSNYSATDAEQHSGGQVYLMLYMGLNCSFDVLVNTRATTEKHLLTDVRMMRAAYRKSRPMDTLYKPSKYGFADAVAKKYALAAEKLLI